MKQTEKGISKVRAYIDRIEDDKAILVGEWPNGIIIPLNILPKDSREGEALVLTIATDEAETKRQEKKAKDLLNEILGN